MSLMKFMMMALLLFTNSYALETNDFTKKSGLAVKLDKVLGIEHFKLLRDKKLIYQFKPETFSVRLKKIEYHKLVQGVVVVAIWHSGAHGELVKLIQIMVY